MTQTEFLHLEYIKLGDPVVQRSEEEGILVLNSKTDDFG